MKHQECIDACQACAVACDECATACLGEKDIHMMAECMRLNRSCADLCILAAREMVRGSDFAASLCKVCAEACEACANECGKHDAGHCQKCAKACKGCAEACRKMAA